MPGLRPEAREDPAAAAATRRAVAATAPTLTDISLGAAVQNADC